MIVMGIDPGAKGAIACVEIDNDKTHLRSIYDMPAHWFDLDTILGDYWQDTVFAVHSPMIFIEDAPTVVKRKGKNVNPATVSKQNRDLGMIIGQCYSISCEPFLINSTKWQSYFGIKSGCVDSTKKQAEAVVKQFFGSDIDKFYGPRGAYRDGRGDAALIALYGALNSQGNGNDS